MTGNLTHLFEKYRPRRIAECVLLPHDREVFESFIAEALGAWTGKCGSLVGRRAANSAIIYGDLIGKLDMLRIQCPKRPPHLNKRRLY
jgi:hypothetical protein